MEEVVIIGGGVAGLSAAFHLANLGLKPLLVEGSHFPSHKVCGEFFSPECTPHLKRFGIEPTLWIKKITFTIKNKRLDFPLPAPAASMSRFFFDHKLKSLAEERGAVILTDTLVQSVDLGKDSTYHIQLSSGEKIVTSSLVIGAGRASELLSTNKAHPLSSFPFIGIKAHFERIDSDQTLEFHFTDSAYLGLSPIDKGKSNVACLAKRESVDRAGGAKKWMESLSQQPEFAFLQNRKMLFPEWLTVSAPRFGVKKCPTFPNVFFIGDARGTIPPITGDGLAIALSSGHLVAEYVKKRDASGFDRAWTDHYKSAIRWGIFLHNSMLRAYLAPLAGEMALSFPRLLPFLFKKTRSG